ncbi:uncharacterized protein C5orf47 homolog [Suncus etruscus]|uniref:uncharacterized protein C5orf47 homolog n=1 Tax=Suncus etruscus TaxID=109475 RepID=UPI00210FC85B|nr:uncharacterized protein C5orf47 homolog [Suncus etruscus]
MAAAGRPQERRATRYVYVARFGSHRCGCVLQRGARRKAWGREEPRGAATAGCEGLGERPPQPGPPADASAAGARRSFLGPSSGHAPAGSLLAGAEGRGGSAAAFASGAPGGRVKGEGLEFRPCRPSRSLAVPRLSQKNLSKKFALPTSLSEASTKMKKRKKDSVWNSVSKVISRMLEENEKYRLRLKCQQSPTERMNPSLDPLTKEDCEEFKDGT